MKKEGHNKNPPSLEKEGYDKLLKEGWRSYRHMVLLLRNLDVREFNRHIQDYMAAYPPEPGPEVQMCDLRKKHFPMYSSGYRRKIAEYIREKASMPVGIFEHRYR